MVQERLITGTGPAWLLSVSLKNELGIAVNLIGKRRGEIDTYGRHQVRVEKTGLCEGCLQGYLG